MDTSKLAYEKHVEEMRRTHPNATVLETQYIEHEPWKVETLTNICEQIARRTRENTEISDLFRYRKSLLKEKDILAFQRHHPKLFWMLTDKDTVSDPKYQKTLGYFLNILYLKESGKINESDANATASKVITTMQ